jgi:hypothetical protein
MRLFVSDRRLRGYKRLPRAAVAWALDSGGFTELSTHGSWDHGPTPAQYTARIRRYFDEVGGLAWAASQDWMCEPAILTRTGLSVAQHQARTVDNYLELRDLAADLDLPPHLVCPTVQGWQPEDFVRCVDRYAHAGVDLTSVPSVAVGTLCRRQATTIAGQILAALHAVGLTRLHGFGFKLTGLARYRHLLTSADSMAWSYAARRRPPLPGCATHINCANCPRYAYHWYRTQVTPILTATPTGYVQPALFDLTGCAA